MGCSNQRHWASSIPSRPAAAIRALSRSSKNVIHLDPNPYYGGAEAAFSLQEVDEWIESKNEPFYGAFSNVEVHKEEDGNGLGSPRAYSLALAPQVIHAKSELLGQLVSSKAFRQVEFLAVGSFYIYQPAEGESQPSLSRIPSTREDVFSNDSIPAKSKRSLMKFLKFVLDYSSEENQAKWEAKASEPLRDFLADEFKLDERLQADVITLTLSFDGNVSVAEGLAAINRHMTSMGLFGAGFAAVYPKWGGLSEIAQVGCRASAVGGAVYMLGTGINLVRQAGAGTEFPLNISLSNDLSVNAKTLVKGLNSANGDTSLSRLTAVIGSDLASMFESIIEGAPQPAVSVVAFPAGYISTDEGEASQHPIYAMLHSSDTGECPSGQCLVYLSTISTSSSKSLLTKALSSLLSAISPDSSSPILYTLSYDQKSGGATTTSVDGNVITFPSVPLDLAFNDTVMEQVRTAWNAVVRKDAQRDESGEYMIFDDREGQGDEDVYD